MVTVITRKIMRGAAELHKSALLFKGKLLDLKVAAAFKLSSEHADFAMFAKHQAELARLNALKAEAAANVEWAAIDDELQYLP